MNRRQFLQTASAGASAFAIAGCATTARPSGPAVTKGRLKQSVVQWCFAAAMEKWNTEKTCQVAKELGCLSVELVPASDYPILKRYGLTCAIGQIDMAPDPPFVKGFNNPTYWPRVIKATEDAIDAAAAFGTRKVICFTGYSAKNPDDPNSPHLSLEEGANNCIAGYKKVLRRAEQKNITLCLEMLNSRDTSHPMKGHPGYQGDHTDYCIDIIKRVGSPNLKLLFDIYHVQIMDGDLIRRIRQLKDYIAHVHTAGNPGRGELDDKQEINYKPIMEALVEIDYQGFVGQEFIPTRNPYQGLREAVSLCDV